VRLTHQTGEVTFCSFHRTHALQKKKKRKEGGGGRLADNFNTIIFTSHNLDVLRSLQGRMAVIAWGKWLKKEGKADRIRTIPKGKRERMKNIYSGLCC